MRFRITLIVLLLVVVPTAVLSLLASRALQNWELILAREMEASAAGAVQAVVERVDLRLSDEMEQARNAVGDAVAAAGGDLALLAPSVRRLLTSREAVRQIYLFMDPWGFVWPPADDVAEPVTASVPAPGEHMVAALRRSIAAMETTSGRICLTVEDVSYCFASIPGARTLYVGYAIDPDYLRRWLPTVAESVTRRDLRILVEGPGLPSVREPPVVIGDSLNPDRPVEESVPADAVVVTRRLRPPLDYIQITATGRTPLAGHRIGALRLRFLNWGTLLLAGVVLAGVGLVAWQGVGEVRRVRARSDFVVGISHDLRTPLASMRILAESLQMDRVADPEKRKTFLGAIVRETERLSLLIERVLFFVRLGQNAIVYSFRAADVRGVVREAVRVLETQVMAAGARMGQPSRIHVALNTEQNVQPVQLDESALLQVFLNLLDNAVRYGGDASTRGPGTAGVDGPVHIDVGVDDVVLRSGWLRRRRNWVRVRIADHGQGISRRDLRRLFRPYYRGAGASRSNVSGVGLGLVLCRHVVTAHRGFIRVESHPGAGSTFSVYLPAG